MSYTVVVWDEGDQEVRTVGPTADSPALLVTVLRRAREQYHDAEIVTWSRMSPHMCCHTDRVDAILRTRAWKRST